MAMKQIKVSRDQTDNCKALVDEVEIFRQLDHPNLVKYYGIEVHKEELLIFMEYCSEGTLGKVCREGLELSCVRRYTHFLLQAVGASFPKDPFYIRYIAGRLLTSIANSP